jgi:hypothetical protein
MSQVRRQEANHANKGLSSDGSEMSTDRTLPDNDSAISLSGENDANTAQNQLQLGVR